MEAIWYIDKPTLIRWRDFVAENEDNDLVIRRKHRNVKRNDIDLSKQAIWRALVGCQITTLQRSGPGSNVGKFLNSDSAALIHKACKGSDCPKVMIESEMRHAKLRFPRSRADRLSRILQNLEGGEWKVLRDHLATLTSYTTRNKERTVVEYLQSGLYPGLGPKQSRNFIQWLGLSRYEVPIDSRVLKHLREFGCNYVPGAAALADEDVYLFVQNGLQQLAEKLDVYPCILDACIFSSFDENGDDEDEESDEEDA